jgi:predicted RNA-binding protein YlqC (UPF0109 family)
LSYIQTLDETITRNPDPHHSMPKRISGIAASLKQLGDIQVTDWDFEGLLHKDIREIEFARSLRRLGNTRVMEWDFRSVLPAVGKLADQEVNVIDLVRRTASYKVMDWDFRSAPQQTPRLTADEMQSLILRLKNFLQYVAGELINEPGHAQIKVREIAPAVLRFRLILVKRDVAMLIGTEGHTAAAIRSLIKAAAASRGVHALLEILSHEQEAARIHDPENRD